MLLYASSNYTICHAQFKTVFGYDFFMIFHVKIWDFRNLYPTQVRGFIAIVTIFLEWLSDIHMINHIYIYIWRLNST